MRTWPSQKCQLNPNQSEILTFRAQVVSNHFTDFQIFFQSHGFSLMSVKIPRVLQIKLQGDYKSNMIDWKVPVLSPVSPNFQSPLTSSQKFWMFSFRNSLVLHVQNEIKREWVVALEFMATTRRLVCHQRTWLGLHQVGNCDSSKLERETNMVCVNASPSVFHLQVQARLFRVKITRFVMRRSVGAQMFPLLRGSYVPNATNFGTRRPPSTVVKKSGMHSGRLPWQRKRLISNWLRWYSMAPAFQCLMGKSR